MNMIIFVALAMCLLPAGRALAAIPSSAGTAGAQFLKLGVGARPAGMAEACTAACDDAYSLYYNPAGLSRISGRGQVVFFHDNRLGLIDHDFVAAAAPIARWDAVVAAGLTRLGTKQSGYDAANAPTGDFATSDIALSIGAAKRFEIFPGRDFEEERFLRAGAASKLLRQTAPGSSASGLAVDAGLQATARETAKGVLTVGMAILNVGPEMGLAGDSSPLPSSLRFGAAYLSHPSKLLIATDLGKSVDGEINANLGLEWRPLGAAAFRAGYRMGQAAGGLLDALTFGGGLKFKGFEAGAAFVGHPSLGSSLLFDVKYGW